MTAMAWEHIAIGISLWLAAGMTFASILYRRGHDGWHWMLVCGIAGPFASLIVADQVRLVEPDARPVALGSPRASSNGVTVVVPAAAIGAVDGRALDRLGLPVGHVAVASSVAFEHTGSVTCETVELAMQATLAEAKDRFAPYPVELVALPGSTADTVARWAADHAPAVIVTTRGAHHPRVLGRLTRLAAERPGVSAIVLDPASLAVAGTPEAR